MTSKSKSDERSTAPVRASSSARTVRETIESIVIAFVLAFLFRTFEAEAFVIPTGSMAPTLQGRHKDVECPKCGRQYQASASVEATDREQDRLPVLRVTCPQCGYRLNVDPRDGDKYPSYSGDRILVGKFSYEFNEPKRWDVIVFKYPEDAKVNYIKRLVGLPGESVRITKGNIYTKGPYQAADEQDKYVIQRKPPGKLEAMLQMVYDNAYQPTELIEKGWPTNWQVDPEAAGSWTIEDGNRTFFTDQPEGSQAWLRYQHFVPTVRDWEAARTGQPITPPTPQLITDHYAYNSYETSRHEGRGEDERPIGDLAIRCSFEVEQPRGKAFFELSRGGESFFCTIDLATGEASLTIPAIPDYAAKGMTTIKSAGTYEILFSNVDDELRLTVDGKPVEFDTPTAYTPTPQMEHPQVQPFDRDRLELASSSPAGIGCEGGAIKVTDLQILRDIYYTSIQPPQNEVGLVEFDMQAFPDDPDNDQFFVLGDNSPQSKDSRLWENNHHYVERKLLIGKALWIYWPHSFGEVEVGSAKIPFPYFPNVARMGFVR